MSRGDDMNRPQSPLLTQRQWGNVLSPMRFKEGDIRAEKLRGMLLKVPVDATFSTGDIVEHCVNAMGLIHISDEDRALLDRETTAEIDEVMPLYASRVAALIRESGKKSANIVSVGCGASGHIESILDAAVKKEFGDVSLAWTGVETTDKRTPGSFFNAHKFAVIPAHETPAYASLVEGGDSLKILMANFSFHHMGTSFGEFLAQCKGFDRVIMLEQPVTKEKWDDPAHRTAKIGHDVLINAALDPAWIEAAKQNPDAFKINYLLEEQIPENAVVTDLPNIVPGCALIDFKPEAAERIPKKIDVVVDLPEGQDILTEISKKPEVRLAICLDMSNGKMYIGDDHTAILRRQSIGNQCHIAQATFNGLENVAVTILDKTFLMRKKPPGSDLLEKMMAAAIRRDILKKQD